MTNEQKAIIEIIELLGELDRYMDDKADCDYQGDPLEAIPNIEMRLLTKIRNAATLFTITRTVPRLQEAAEWVRPKIVCYCGSLRVAMEDFKKAEYDAVLRGEIALLPCCMFVDIQREYGAESDYKQKADELHKRKIDICDEVFVLNVNGYIGESTNSEIEYAKEIGKPVKYLEPLF